MIFLKTKEEIYDAIKVLAVRGAPAIGICAGYAMYVLAAQYQREGHPEFAKPAAQKAYSVLNRKWTYRVFMPRLFKRIVRGKRGSARIARWLMR